MPRRNHTPKHEPFQDNSSCRSKRRFPNEREAQAAAETQELLDHTLTLTTYKCERCGGWHLTRREPGT